MISRSDVCAKCHHRLAPQTGKGQCKYLHVSMTLIGICVNVVQPPLRVFGL